MAGGGKVGGASKFDTLRILEHSSCNYSIDFQVLEFNSAVKTKACVTYNNGFFALNLEYHGEQEDSVS